MKHKKALNWIEWTLGVLVSLPVSSYILTINGHDNYFAFVALTFVNSAPYG